MPSFPLYFLCELVCTISSLKKVVDRMHTKLTWAFLVCNCFICGESDCLITEIRKKEGKKGQKEGRKEKRKKKRKKERKNNINLRKKATWIRKNWNSSFVYISCHLRGNLNIIPLKSHSMLSYKWPISLEKLKIYEKILQLAHALGVFDSQRKDDLQMLRI